MTDVGSCEHAALPSTRYKAYADCAGGTGSDSFAFAIAHRSGNVAVLDVLREFKPRFIPAQVIDSLAQLCKAYNGIHEVQGDKYAVGFHQAEWRTHGIRFVACDRSTSENYLALLPLLLAGRARLLDNKTLRGQLSALERRVGAGDRETVTHPQHASAHDDVACASCRALALAAKYGSYPTDLSWVNGPTENAAEEFQQARFERHIFQHSGFYRQWR